VTRSTRPSLRLIALSCILLLSLVGLVSAWNASPNNPRDGWSWIKTSLGITGPSPSGDRAFHELRTVRSRLIIDPQDRALDAHVTVLLRRTRYGLFKPWLETKDLRFLDLTGQAHDWNTGTANPDWPALLQAARAHHQQVIANTTSPNVQTYHQLILAAIDTEVAGGYPARRILWSALASDAMYVLAHSSLIVLLFLLARQAFVASRTYHRAMRSRCIHCGYDAIDTTGLINVCPECGQDPRSQSVQSQTSLPE